MVRQDGGGHGAALNPHGRQNGYSHCQRTAAIPGYIINHCYLSLMHTSHNHSFNFILSLRSKYCCSSGLLARQRTKIHESHLPRLCLCAFMYRTEKNIHQPCFFQCRAKCHIYGYGGSQRGHCVNRCCRNIPGQC